MKRNYREFSERAIGCVYDLDIIGVAMEAAIPSLEAEIEDLLKLNDENTLKARHAHFCIPETNFVDYEEHFYELCVSKNVLAGIRHKNGSKDQPFVHTLLDFVPTNSEIELLKDFASKQFHKFAPKYLSLWLRPSLKLDFLNDEALPSRQYVVGSIPAFRDKKSPLSKEFKICLAERKSHRSVGSYMLGLLMLAGHIRGVENISSMNRVRNDGYLEELFYDEVAAVRTLADFLYDIEQSHVDKLGLCHGIELQPGNAKPGTGAAEFIARFFEIIAISVFED